MITYEPFWNTLKHSSETTYTLINKYNINSTTITRLRNNEPVTTRTLNDLCRILKCELHDIVIYIDEENDGAAK